jgi:hypothetical protein
MMKMASAALQDGSGGGSLFFLPIPDPGTKGQKRHTIPDPQHWGGNESGRKRGREVMVRAEREKVERREKFSDFLQEILHLSQV